MLAYLVYLISGLAITPIVKSKLSLSKKDYSLLLITSISGGAIAPAMFFFGLKLTTAVDSSLLSNGEIIFSIILAVTLFGEKLNHIGYVAMVVKKRLLMNAVSNRLVRLQCRLGLGKKMKYEEKSRHEKIDNAVSNRLARLQHVLRLGREDEKKKMKYEEKIKQEKIDNLDICYRI